ncbi:hypothetical protein pEaSNUABM37_00139 [Erwinia phage pEa_SNUABM_37]|nr:hypothetical protein pEaSNUABM37_00139 [Erwinia phage pEa_SNUABM_37]QXO10609.1 hypothetical protein pEaSNUABM48_00139 [Erwinia phage pEa_SNUABM_48]
MKDIIIKVAVSVVVSVAVTKALNAYNKKVNNGVTSRYTFIKL